MSKPPYDPRAVANLLLDLADGAGLSISNLALQKLLYFAHAQFLVRTGQPLVQGAFEAWTYGPVHPAVYQAFKAESARPIKMRAQARNMMTGEAKDIPTLAGNEVRDHLRQLLGTYGHLPPEQLVKISHAPNGPWAKIVQQAKTSVSLGMRIPDSVTRQYFRYYWIVVGPGGIIGEHYEDTPIVRDRFG